MNPYQRLGRPLCCHYTTSANRGDSRRPWAACARGACRRLKLRSCPVQPVRSRTWSCEQELNLQPGAYDAPALPVELSQHGRGDNRLRDRHGNFATAWFCQLNAFMAVALGLVLPAGIEPARYVLASYIITGGFLHEKLVGVDAYRRHGAASFIFQTQPSQIRLCPKR